MFYFLLYIYSWYIIVYYKTVQIRKSIIPTTNHYIFTNENEFMNDYVIRQLVL
jgi:hypothetical protein